jgi:RNA polymerase sigma factor (sigma-70 family)
MSTPVHALLRTQSDARLVSLAAEGSSAAFEAIVDRYRDQLVRACRRTLPGALVDDAVQQAFVNAWAALQAGAEVRELRAWLHQVARHCGYRLLRDTRSAEDLHQALQAADCADDVFERRLRLRATLDAVAALPTRQREALIATAVDGRSGHDVALGLGLNESAVRQLVRRARSTVRQAAAALVPGPVVRVLAARASAPGAEVAAAPLLGGTVGLVFKAVAVAAIAAGAAGTARPLLSHRAAARASAVGVVASGTHQPTRAPDPHPGVVDAPNPETLLSTDPSLGDRVSPASHAAAGGSMHGDDPSTDQAPGAEDAAATDDGDATAQDAGDESAATTDDSAATDEAPATADEAPAPQDDAPPPDDTPAPQDDTPPAADEPVADAPPADDPAAADPPPDATP